jgi:hypothetical protein
MELQSQEKGGGWCNSCAQSGSDFLETILSTGGKGRKLASPTFRVNVAHDSIGTCPLCRLLRVSITTRLLDPQCMDVRLCLKASDPYLVAIEYPRSGLYDCHRGDVSLLSDPGKAASLQGQYFQSLPSYAKSHLTEIQTLPLAKPSAAEESANQAPKAS